MHYVEYFFLLPPAVKTLKIEEKYRHFLLFLVLTLVSSVNKSLMIFRI